MIRWIFAIVLGFSNAWLGAQSASEMTLTPAATEDTLKNPEAGPVHDYDLKFREIAKELRCPTCTGLSVLESDASFSLQIKSQVKEQMLMGKDKEQVLTYFVDRYGPWILREPPKQGFNLLAWAVPIALLCLGPIAIWLLVWKRNVTVSTHGVRANEPIIAEMQERLQQLRKGN